MWAEWMRTRYVKGHSFNATSVDHNSSPMWVHMMKSKEMIQSSFDFNEDSRKGTGTSISLKNIMITLQPPGAADPLAEGVWTCRTSKMAITLWRLRWNRLHTFNRLRQWGQEVPDVCTLCGEVDETPEHLFLNCNFSRELWLKFTDGKHFMENSECSETVSRRPPDWRRHRGPPTNVKTLTLLGAALECNRGIHLAPLEGEE